MVKINEQTQLFEIIGTELKEKTECFVIGGSAMMFYGAKEDTKDVDLVFLKKEGLEKVKKVLEKMSYRDKKELVKIFRRYEDNKNRPIMMVGLEGQRIDLFFKEIITFEMSDTIVNRVKETHEFGNLIIKVVSPEDIILLKCATEREKDRFDALSLMEKFDIDWDIIIEETVNQTKLESYLFPVYLYDFLEELKEDFKADIPIEVLRKIRKISENLLEEKLGKKKK